MRIYIFILLLFLPSIVLASGSATNYENPFGIVYGGAGNNVYGNYKAIASSVECAEKDGKCDWTYSGTNNPNEYLYNSTTMYINSVSTSVIPLNSSTETLTLPSDINGSDILYAGLYWQGHIAGTDAGDYSTGIIGRNQVDLIDPNGTLHQITAKKLWYLDFWGDGTGYDGGYRSFYQGYQDITTIVQNSYSTTHTNNFTVGDIKANQGHDNFQYAWIDGTSYNGLAFGYWGNWTLVVVYQHPYPTSTQTARNVTLFQGFQPLIPLPNDPTKTITLPLSGFLTPEQAPVNASLYFYGTGAEQNLAYDTLQIQNQNNVGSYTNLSNHANPIADAFNDSVSNFGTDVNASKTFYPGLDADDFNVSNDMGLKQSSTVLKLGTYFQGSSGDQFFPGFIAFSTDLYQPKFCYDYSYSQNGVYFTEDYNSKTSPRLQSNGSNVVVHQPIMMKIYLKNLVASDINVTDMNLSVENINTSIVQYINGTVSLVPPGSVYDINVSKSTIQSPGSILNIPVGTVPSQGYLYLYYKLDPQTSTFNTPIKVVAHYNIHVGTTTIPYVKEINSSIPICSPDNFVYTPAKGIFDIVDDAYYNPLASSPRYYNLPTQTTSRDGNLKIISLDPNNLDTLESNTSTIVGVDMIDASAFHDVNASCDDENSSISDRVWVVIQGTYAPFDGNAIQNAITNSMTTLSNKEAFYTQARRNAAFRVSYNVTNDGNASLVQLEKNGTKWVIKNFTELVQGIGQCKQYVYSPTGSSKNTQYTNQVAVACGNAGTSGIYDAHLKACMECLYGYNTRMVCSRDNFAIRPAAFNITIKDQSQTPQPSYSKSASLTSTLTGVLAPAVSDLNLSAGYNYDLNITAVNAQDNNASPGYYTSLANIQDDNASYLWAPGSLTLTGCNDDSNRTSLNDNNTSLFLSFSNGDADMNTSINQVGKYVLHLIDTTWTAVDHDQADMTHHIGTYFLSSSTPDCVKNNSSTPAEGADDNQTGCDISSNSDNSLSGLKYRDISVTFHPYKFDMTTIVPSLGINHDTTSFGTNGAFVYMSDMNNTADENMSFHLNGAIRAVGENNATLSNFVKQCYAVPVELNVSKTAITTPPGFQYRFHDFNSTGSSDSNISGYINNTDGNFTVTEGNFSKDNNGTLVTTFNLNFDRNQTQPENPQQIRFITYQTNCQTVGNCTFYADLNSSKTTTGVVDLNKTVDFYYGRTHAPRYKFQGNTGTAKIYYEVYCDKDGNTSLLPNGVDTNVSVDSINWYNNEYNTPAKDGDIGTVSEKRLIPNVTPTTPTTTSPSQTNLTYNENAGYPYQTTMENNASGWLIYNPYDSATKVNTFDVEFYKADTNWTGVQGTNTSTDSNASSITNQRILW